MKRNYMSYLLRLWQTSSEPPIWVASLEDPHTHKVIQLPSLEALLPYLKQVIDHQSGDPECSDETKDRPQN